MVRGAQRATSEGHTRQRTSSLADASRPNHAAVRLALAHLDRHERSSLPPWSAPNITPLRGGVVSVAHRRFQPAAAAAALGLAGAQLVDGIALVSLLASDGPFGAAWAGHAFASDGFRDRAKLREPDLTFELARLLGPTVGRRGAERARSFLRVLADLAGAGAVREALTDEVRPTVTAEHAVGASRRGTQAMRQAGSGGKRRLDLLFEWPLDADGRRAVVAVEAKLGAPVSEGQLRPYAEAARRRARGGPLALVLLTATPDAAERRNRSWRAVRWFSLLRRWEAALAVAGDADPAFARLRARLWRYLLANPGALR